MSPRPLIFISAVTKELKSARQLVANTLTFLGYEAVWQDIFGTETGDLRQVLREKIDQCKGVVQLVGQFYGAEPPVPDEKFGRTSYTQYEALYARDCGKKVWYLFIDKTFPVDQTSAEPAELISLQQAYRSRLEADSHVFHHLATREALEGSILKLRDDLGLLRRGVKRWAVTVVALLLLLAAMSIWVIQAQRRQTGVIREQGAQVNSLLDRYRKMEQALVRLAEVEAKSKQPGVKASPEEQRAAAYGILEKELGLAAGSLAKELPAFALELYNRSDTGALMRARAAYALGKFDEAERLSVEGALADKRAYETAVQVQGERRRAACEGYLLAGQSAQKRIQYDKAMEYLREAEKLVDRNQTPNEWISVQYSIGDLLLDRGEYRPAESLLSSVVELCTQVKGPLDPDTLRSRNLLAFALMRGGKAKDAESQLREIIDLEVRVFGPEDPATLSSMHRLGIAMFFQGRHADADAQYRKVIQLREKVLGPEHPDTLRSRSNLAATIESRGNYAEAEAENREILRLREKVLGPEHPDTLTSRGNLAGELLQQGKIQEAESQFREVAALYQKVLGPAHPETLRIRENLALTTEMTGNTAEAERQLRDILKIKEDALGPEHPDTLSTRGNLAVALEREARFPEAEVLNREIFKLKEKLLGPEHPGTLLARGNLAVSLEKQGKYPEAEAENREVVRLKEKVLGPEHAETLLNRRSLAVTLFFQGKYVEGEAQIREVIRVQEKTLGPEHPETLESYHDFATGLQREGKTAEAMTFARQAADRARKVYGPEHPDTKRYQALVSGLEGH